MRPLIQIMRLLWRAERRSLTRAVVLSVLVLAMGAALLGLSGWFITAAAAAGLAGTGVVFDVFRPSASVRFLAMGRAAARYGERLTSHDATLRALERLRLRLLSGMTTAPFQRQARLRGAQAVNRVMADVDALDGVSLRLALPIIAGLVTLTGAAVAIAWLWGALPALVVGLGYGLGAVAVLIVTTRRAVPLARRAEAAAQAFRSRLVTLTEARRDLAAASALVGASQAVADAEARRLALRRALDRIERRTGAAIMLLTGGIATLVFWLGIEGAQAGRIAPSIAAMGLLATLALAEALAPLRRAVAEIGRMADAARRVAPVVAAPLDAATPMTPAPAPIAAPSVALLFDRVTLARPGTDAPLVQGLSGQVARGQVLALRGASGVGKSSLLHVLAGLETPLAGQVHLLGRDLRHWDEPALRARLGLVAQRATLLSGSLADNLSLGCPQADEDAMWQALSAVQLAGLVADRGGLSLRLGPRGEGLSGGEARRLAVARALLRRPDVLLLDEPTEGLDAPTAGAVLAGVRALLPDTAFVVASHRPEEVAWADTTLWVE